MITALVPVKALDQAKGRLASLLLPDQRRRLSMAMLEDVLRALGSVSSVDHVAVVSPDPIVLARAPELGAEAIPEPPVVRGVNQALAHAAGVLSDRGADVLLVVVADLPSVLPADIESVLGSVPRRGIAVVPTGDGGTGVLALRPPDAIPFRFGRRSSAAHRREAVARGLTAQVLHLDSLSRDVDQPEDLMELLAHPADTATHRLLAAMPPGRLGAPRPA